MPTPAPVQFTTGTGSLAGTVNGGNLLFSFSPLPKLLLYQQIPNQAGSLVFRNGLLVDEYEDYAAGHGFYLLTSILT